QSLDPRHLHFGSAICRRPFFVVCCAQRRATVLPCVAEDCLLANKFSATILIPASYAHAFALSVNAMFVSVALILFGVAAFAEIKLPQMTASIGCIQSLDPRHLHFGSAICRRPFLWCVACKCDVGANIRNKVPL
ncbi:MAG: hypothetical protein IKC12_06925, partial [Alistipes sp.]|nr:hypothetical protein [Alistipes sp.]